MVKQETRVKQETTVQQETKKSKIFERPARLTTPLAFAWAWVSTRRHVQMRHARRLVWTPAQTPTRRAPAKRHRGASFLLDHRICLLSPWYLLTLRCITSGPPRGGCSHDPFSLWSVPTICSNTSCWHRGGYIRKPLALISRRWSCKEFLDFFLGQRLCTCLQCSKDLSTMLAPSMRQAHTCCTDLQHEPRNVSFSCHDFFLPILQVLASNWPLCLSIMRAGGSRSVGSHFARRRGN